MTIYNQAIESYDEKMAKDVIMLAGRILLESGAEGSRVEDTMTRIAITLGHKESNSFVTNTVINFMLHDESYPRMYRIRTRDTNLHRISRTNGISRRLALGNISLEDAFQELQKIYQEQSIKNHYLFYKFIAAAVISVSFLYLQGGHLTDVLTALLAGSFGYIVVEILQQKLHAQFIPEFMGALVIGLVTIIGHNLISGGSISTIIIAAVMPIVPGVLITNAIQDLFGGHMLMFTTKSLESLVTAFGIGAGVSTVLIIF
ncbi:threonine/serine exporter family protein [Staphylococcus saprophyticus]|nr:threonine/serine exporter family protein [Staphylococcus saprophyticus]MDL1994818.1 threonine/serine exporter family protein [Staphylococcus saprophyticus]MDT3917764.1 threonine/serine exporter family protein [Staphylococcus saprophyticus]MDT3925589.1 threonine/serine exporter family protein [Staphylococcus saprophyticus]MDT3967865.1 threonine/serine exporter family protein [Staphylococcus saprophyticus]MDT3971840.1 threonine/serine exporter family protein [Staphylococcus saprophyticus]